MPALHVRVFNIESHNTVDNSFDSLQGVKLDIILDLINSDNLLIDYCDDRLYIEWHVDGGQLQAVFNELENY